MFWPMFKANPTFEEILAVSSRLRPRDKLEIYPLMTVETPEQIAKDHFNDGSRPQVDWAVCLPSGPVVILGATENFPGNWQVYMFATPKPWQTLPIMAVWGTVPAQRMALYLEAEAMPN